MKKMLFLIVVVLSAKTAFAQLNMNDIYSIGISIHNPFTINIRDILNIKENWLAKGYVMSMYQRANASGGSGFEDVFEFTNTGNGAEKFRIVTTDITVNGQRIIKYNISAYTQDLSQYNSWLTWIRQHPDFTRTSSSDNIFTEIYDAKPSVGEKQRVIFSLGYDTIIQTPLKVQVRTPTTYSVELIRPF